MQAMQKKISSLISELDIPDEGKVILLSKAEKYLNECGCNLGASFVLAALTGMIIFRPMSGSVPRQVFVTLGIIALAGVFGKFVGIWAARLKLIMLSRSIAAMHSACPNIVDHSNASPLNPHPNF